VECIFALFVRILLNILLCTDRNNDDTLVNHSYASHWLENKGITNFNGESASYFSLISLYKGSE